MKKQCPIEKVKMVKDGGGANLKLNELNLFEVFYYNLCRRLRGAR
mgnify:CR=1 FL=1